MLETYNAVLLNSFRNLKKNIKASPGLYALFFFMIVFTSFFLGFLTVFLLRTEVEIDINNVFLVVFFLFVIKASHDFYQYFTKSHPVTYALSTQVSHWKTVFDVFLVVFWIQLGLWVFFSSIYTASLVFAGVDLIYPLLYLKFTFGIMLSSVLGTLIALHYFSKKKYRLLPLGLLLFIVYQYPDLISILLVLLLSFLYLFLSLTYSLDSYQFVSRKMRKKEQTQLWLSNPLKAIFYKEVIMLWREKVLFSVLFSAVVMGIGTGYLARFGAADLLPESLQVLASMVNPETYAFFGIYVLTIHGAVFISLSFFLNEDTTLWLLRHVPVPMREIVYGKASALLMPFLCSIPFIAYYAAFTSTESILYLIWFLIFSYLAAIIICFPLGARYVGKKSDIMLLYSTSLMSFIVLGVAFFIDRIIYLVGFSRFFVYGLVLLVELGLIVVSMKVTAHVLSVAYPLH